MQPDQPTNAEFLAAYAAAERRDAQPDKPVPADERRIDELVGRFEERILDWTATWEAVFDAGPGQACSVSDAARVVARLAASEERAAYERGKAEQAAEAEDWKRRFHEQAERGDQDAQALLTLRRELNEARLLLEQAEQYARDLQDDGVGGDQDIAEAAVEGFKRGKAEGIAERERAVADALIEVDYHVGALPYIDRGGVPYVEREWACDVVNKAAKQIFGDGWSPILAAAVDRRRATGGSPDAA